MAVMDRNMPLGDANPDDLPRTLRREREARERAQQKSPLPSAPMHVPEPDWVDRGGANGAIVTGFDVPFLSLMAFCLKLVLAAVPALILLGAILWGLGQLLTTFFPWLVKMEILLRIPR